jgi:hypothetical protein
MSSASARCASLIASGSIGGKRVAPIAAGYTVARA